MQEILELVDKYITEKHKNKKWIPGKDWVQYAGPYFGSEEYVAAIKSLLNEWLVLGADAIKFEREFPKLLGKRYGLLTNSGSSANLLMMAALKSRRGFGLPEGTKVIVPVAGFPTTLNPILQVGFRPVFVDIELDTLNINPDRLEAVCKQNPDARVLTFAHVLGNPPNMDRIMEIVNKYDLILLEDCCDALDSSYNNIPLGAFGHMSSCSFYPAHHMTMGEGGFVAMHDVKTERIVRSFREWGRGCYCVGKQNLLENGACGCRFNNWLPALPEQKFDHKYTYEEIGYNLKPIELQASMGLIQMKKLPAMSLARKANYKALYRAFSKYPEYFYTHTEQPGADVSWFAFPVTLKNNIKFDRAELCQFFEQHRIQTRPYFAGNLLLQPAYNEKYYQIDPLKFPIATKVTSDTFFLGTSPVITKEKTDYIEETLDKFIQQL